VAAAAAAKVSAKDPKTSLHREISTLPMTPEEDRNAVKTSYFGNKQIIKASDHWYDIMVVSASPGLLQEKSRLLSNDWSARRKRDARKSFGG
jgi:hypothetical protein